MSLISLLSSNMYIVHEIFSTQECKIPPISLKCQSAPTKKDKALKSFIIIITVLSKSNIKIQSKMDTCVKKKPHNF